MKQKYDINKIKRLLEAYYDGNTSIEQEKLLCDFFATSTDIPAELEPDRQIFATLHTTALTQIDIPTDLEQKLVSHIDNMQQHDERNNKKWIKTFAYISAAACAIALFTLGLKIFNSNDNHINQEVVLASDNKNIDSIKGNNNLVQEIEAPEPILPQEKPMPKVEKKKKRAKRQRVINANQLKSVSDEQIAYENTERALLLLSEKLNKAQKGINKTQSTINEVNNTITDII